MRQIGCDYDDFIISQAGTLLGSVIGSAIGLAKRKEIKAALIKGGKYGIVVGMQFARISSPLSIFSSIALLKYSTGKQ